MSNSVTPWTEVCQAFLCLSSNLNTHTHTHTHTHIYMLYYLFYISLYQHTQNCPMICIFVNLPKMFVASVSDGFYILICKPNLFTHRSILEFYQHISITYLLPIMFLLHSPSLKVLLNFLWAEECCYCSIFKIKFILSHFVWVPLESWPWVSQDSDLDENAI